MKHIKNYRKGQGSKCKPAGLIFLLWTEAHTSTQGAAAALVAQLAGARGGLGFR
jgi:hypothetical protein